MRKPFLLLLSLALLFALDVIGSYAEPCPGGGDDCEMFPVHQSFLPIAAGVLLPLPQEWITPRAPMTPAGGG